MKPCGRKVAILGGARIPFARRDTARRGLKRAAASYPVDH